MFPRAARFDPDRGDDVPGPNAYDPTQPESQYKRGAMFEKDARFRAAAARQGRDSLSSSTGSTSSQATTSKVQLDSRMVSLEKERVRWEQRALKAEEKLKTSQEQAQALQRDKKQMQIDHRLLQQKLDKAQQSTTTTRPTTMARTSTTPRNSEIQELKQQLQASEAQRERQNVEMEALQQRNRQLDERHQASEERMEMLRTEMETLERANFQLQDERRAARNETDRTEARRRATEVSLLELAQVNAALQGALEEEKDGMRDALHSLHDAQDMIKYLRTRFQTAEEERQRDQRRLAELEAAALAEKERRQAHDVEHDAEPHDQDYLDQVERQRAALLSVSLRLASENTFLRHAAQEDATKSRFDAIRIRRLEAQRDEDQQQIRTLNDAIQSMHADHSWQEAHQISRELASIQTERSDTNIDQFDAEQHSPLNDQEIRRKQLDYDLAILTIDEQQIRLAWQASIMQRLQNELNIERLRVVGEPSTGGEHEAHLHLELEETRGKLIAVEQAYNAGVVQLLEAREIEEHLNAQLEMIHGQIDEMADRMHGIETLEVQIRQAGEREEGLLQDRQELLDDLARASNYEAAFYAIRAEAQKLLTRLHGQHDAHLAPQDLHGLRTALASHRTNHLQPISYLDRIRAQLDESQQQYHEMEQERNTLHRRCRELQTEVDAWAEQRAERTTDTFASTSANDDEHELDGTNLSEPPSLAQAMDEREAARRAWQARPRSRNARQAKTNGTPVLRERASRTRLAVQETVEVVPPLPNRIPAADRRTVSSSTLPRSVNASLQDDSGVEVCSSSDGTTQSDKGGLLAAVDAATRRYLRPLRLDLVDDTDRASPVASMPSIEALAWELDKENLRCIAQGERQPNKTTHEGQSLTRPARLLDGELTLHDLTGL